MDDMAFFGVNKECTKFCFGGGCGDEFKDGDDDMNSTIKFDWNVWPPMRLRASGAFK